MSPSLSVQDETEKIFQSNIGNQKRREAMPKIKFSSNFLKERRLRLGYEPYEVADRVGVQWETYRQWECRGEIPEKHLPKLAVALQIPETELKAEKVAVIVEAMLGIPKQETHGFISRALRGNT